MTYTAIYATTGICTGVLRSDGMSIPLSPLNRDYRDFLAWNAAQPVPISTANKPPYVPTAAELRVLALAILDGHDVFGIGVSLRGMLLGTVKGNLGKYQALRADILAAVASGAAD